jgi:hypothetical protein
MEQALQKFQPNNNYVPPNNNYDPVIKNEKQKHICKQIEKTIS